MKKIILVLLLLVSAFTVLFAASYSNKWTWSTSDEKVNFFRYQLENQEDNNWTVVDKDQTQVSYNDMDESVHTLNVQMSYDGENWGPSVSSSTELQGKTILKVPEEKEVEKETEMEDEVEVVVAEKKDLFVITFSPLVSLDVNDVWWPANFKFGTSFGGEIGFDIYNKDSRFGWGYLLGVIYSPSLVLKSGDPAETALTAKLGIDVSVRLGEQKKWSAALNGGITSSWAKDAFLSSNFSSPAFGVFGGIGVRYAVLKNLALGVLLNYNHHF